MKTIIIDNYDSFTYNLVHMVNEINQNETVVMKNDRVDYDVLNHADNIVLSPGPGVPDEAGALKQIINHYKGKKPMLGVCLGHQAIAEVFGASLYNLNQVHHGLRSLVKLRGVKSLLFEGVPKEFYAGRYHSWVIDPKSDLSQLEITAFGHAP